MPDVIAAFQALPAGTHIGKYQGARYVFSKTSFANGKSWKLVAEQLDGTDYVSLNLYALQDRTVIRPCEMSLSKVCDFILGLRPEPEDQ